MCADSLPLIECIASRLDWNTPAFKATILVTGKPNKIRSLWRTNIFDIINLPISNLMLHLSVIEVLKLLVLLLLVSHELHQAKHLLERMTDGDRPTTKAPGYTD